MARLISVMAVAEAAFHVHRSDFFYCVGLDPKRVPRIEALLILRGLNHTFTEVFLFRFMARRIF